MAPRLNTLYLARVPILQVLRVLAAFLFWGIASADLSLLTWEVMPFATILFEEQGVKAPGIKAGQPRVPVGQTEPRPYWNLYSISLFFPLLYPASSPL